VKFGDNARDPIKPVHRAGKNIGFRAFNIHFEKVYRFL
jgi:hypothetical protein